MWCAWQVTYRCNFRCAFCGYWRSPERLDEEQTIDDFRIGADKLARLGTLMISLAGGEPLVRDDIVDVVAEVSRKHITFLTTNGWRMTPELARDLFAAGLWGVSVSLDYATPEQHDKARGVKGAWRRAVRAIEAVSEARTSPHQRINIMSVLMHDNLDHIEPLIELARERDANFMLQPYCAMKTGDRAYIPPTGSAKHLVSLKRRHGNFLSNIEFLKKFDHAANGGVPGCLAGRAFFNIDHRGMVAPCVELRDRPVGDLRRDGIGTILKRLRRNADVQGCRACWYNCRGEIESIYTVRGALEAVRTLVANPVGAIAWKSTSSPSSSSPPSR
jgi:MoaA/NifB/PqqE/SkfB family radical SAM enzyme